VTTCTKTSSEADRPELEIKWGDGTSDTLIRANIEFDALYDVQINTYIGDHAFTGPDSYIISVEDPNRNSDVINITNSVDKVFCIQTELIISPFIGTGNNSLIIEDCPCPEFACVNEIYCYNISAYDPDGDSLSYSLVPCRGEDCLEMSIPTIYKYPNAIGGGEISIDPVTGTMCWDFPSIQGTYNIAIKISEYRQGLYIGSVLQDMQFDVVVCPHEAPSIEEIPDTCIFAGTSLDIPVVGSDPTDIVTVSATGAVFYLAENPATFIDSTALNSATGRFLWDPSCNEASNTPYAVTVHVEDLHPGIQLKDLSTFLIKVNIPPVENLEVTPLANSMNLSWDPSSCDNISYYNIYRSIDSSEYVDDCCESNATELMGYTLIGTSTTTNFTDSSELIVGNDYCYIITAVSDKNVESCVSLQDCAHLNFEIPVLTHVSVMETAVLTGQDSVKWAYPKELNTFIYTGPYNYKLYRQAGDGIEVLVYTSPLQASIVNPDTLFLDTGINTEEVPHKYRVELYNDNLLVGSSISATSIFLELIPNDNQIELIWEEPVPWTNTNYEIYKETTAGSGVFNLIGTTSTPYYLDDSLVNGTSYCYKIRTIGAYTSDGIISPILNWSQEACEIPYDYTPPCAPTLFIDGDCELEETYLNWTNPNNECADDVTRYNIYFAPFEGDSLTFLTTIENSIDTFYVHKDRGSIAGCYYITAIDSIPYNNESLPSNMLCIDNCEGYYELPNIFTPNNNGVNDLYHPLLPFKFVESIELTILNRWGTTVFETTDPFIYWDGKNQESGEPCPDGVYFYTVVVNEVKLSGIIPRSFYGQIQILSSQQ
jgi:gliding motility-associated-like protein